jgi:acetyl/propionyl-CoA carboxylase alpha subunit
MGSKLAAKEAKNNIPMVPGLDHAITDNTLKKSQVRLIYSIKASAGGGGKGMRSENEQSNSNESCH